MLMALLFWQSLVLARISHVKQTLIVVSVTPSGGKGLSLTFNHPGDVVWHRSLGGHTVGNLVPASP